MKLFNVLFLIFIFALSADAGLPPTTSKAVGDSTNKVTFNFQFPEMAVSRTGITSSFTYQYATPSLAGTVSTAIQEFAGDKTWDGTLLQKAHSAFGNTATIDGESSYSVSFLGEETTSNSPVVQTGSYIDFFLNPSTDNNGALYTGLFNNVTVKTGNTKALDIINVSDNRFDHNGSGVISDAYGFGSELYNHALGTINNLYGGYTFLSNEGSVGNGYGFYIFAPANTGTWTNNYGVYIEDQSSVGSTNSYNIYSAGAGSNLFQGYVATGNAAVPNTFDPLYPAPPDTSMPIYFVNSNTFSQASNNAFNFVSYLDFNPSTSGSGEAWGFDIETISRSGNSHSFDYIQGGYISADHRGSGAVNTIWGNQIVFSNSGGAAVGAMIGLELGPGSTNGPLTSGYGLLVDTFGSATHATNLYGIYLADQSGQATNAYNLYSAGTTVKNWFEGLVYGLSFITTAANPASGGVLRLASTDAINWRNNANNGNIALAKNTSDALSYNGTAFLSSATVLLAAAEPAHTGDVTNSAGSLAMTAAATQNNITSIPNLVTVGTITSGTWHGTVLGPLYGGTGIDTSASTGYPSISSGTWSVATATNTFITLFETKATTSGDILYGGASGVPTRLAANGTATNKYLQSVSSGAPSWVQVAFSDLSGSVTAAQMPALTGDVTSSAGAVVTTAAATQNNITSIPNLVTVGTITSGTWHGTILGALYGGTGINTSASTGYPSIATGTWSVATVANTFITLFETVATTAGDLLYGGTSGTPTRLASNSTATNKYLQTVSSGNPAYAQVAFSDLSGTATKAQETRIPPIIQQLTSGTTYNLEYAFVITSGSATAAATYTNNSITFTVFKTVASSTLVYMSGSGAPLSSGTLTKASGTGDSTLTFSQAVTPMALKFQGVGAGGGGKNGPGNIGAGGAGGGAGGGCAYLTVGNPSATYTYAIGAAGTANGGTGGTTTVGSTILSAAGGTGGAAAAAALGGAGGSGGAATVGDVTYTGADGDAGGFGTTGVINGQGGNGGSSGCLGGGGQGGAGGAGTGNGAAGANYGSGGGGGAGAGTGAAGGGGELVVESIY